MFFFFFSHALIHFNHSIDLHVIIKKVVCLYDSNGSPHLFYASVIFYVNLLTILRSFISTYVEELITAQNPKTEKKITLKKDTHDDVWSQNKQTNQKK